MAVKPQVIDRLKAQLLTSGIQQQNQALFQVINQLIDALRATAEVAADVTSGGSGVSLGQSFLTEGNETGSLPNSRELVAGAGITLNPAPAGKLIITTAIPFGMDSGGEGEDGPPGPPGQSIVGPAGAPGPAGSNAVSQLYAFDGIDGEDAPIIPGPQGLQGLVGPAGSAGVLGPAGIDGEDGVDSFIPGPPGATGSAGAAGIQGIQGNPGPPGLDGDGDSVEPLIYIPPPNVIGGVMFLMRVAADQTINAGAGVFTDITGLTFPVVNGRDYAFQFYVAWRSAATTTGWKAGVNHPGGTVDFFHSGSTIANSTNLAATFPQRHGIAVDDMTLLTSTITAAADLLSMITGRYKCTANGTFAARFANELAANTDIVVQKGSWGWSF